MISGVQLVEYILKKCGSLSHKDLQKLAYLVDLEYMKTHGERLSDLQFKKFYYGPYSEGIEEIKQEDDNIINTDHKTQFYPSKISSLKSESISLESHLKSEIDEILMKYKGKTGKELEDIADNTEPYIDIDIIGEKIDLDGYAEHYKSLLSDNFWENAFKAREENERKGVYGKHVISDDSELNALFS